ncbi:hypothetical protein FNV43_RR24207 [Rhamnella rubrinervis]|uniref:Trichome birefringence-like N-terminal domain-containing protein n=1 Tax=Rhamnella rubrinervis TaxID=2594499 RepID=A0A8K0GSY1_9ROSA|nr:hypothetical protein FNV43_RR24207 [Rhamnella rubrinervis]
MTWASPKHSFSMNAYPKTLSWIAYSILGLALFLTLASWVLVSYPIGPTVRGYFYAIDSSQKLELSTSSANQTAIDHRLDVVDNNVSSNSSALVPTNSSSFQDGVGEKLPFDSNSQAVRTPGPFADDNAKAINKSPSGEFNSQVPYNSTGSSLALETKEAKDQEVVPVSSTGSLIEGSIEAVNKDSAYKPNSQLPVNSTDPPAPVQSVTSSGSTQEDASSNVTKNKTFDKSVSKGSLNNSDILDMRSNNTTPTSSDSKSDAVPALSHDSDPSNISSNVSVDSGCNLYHGNWFYDSSGPLYTNNTCPVLTQMQNCQGNGRPDKDYENWRWKPFQCNLPRFDGRKFFDLMRGKTIAFIGDSVARNQMESLLCILWQVEVPKNRGNRNMQRYYFKSRDVTVVRIWSSWLVKQTSEPFDFAPEGVAKLHLDAPDDHLMQFIPKFDVIVVSSGHWFAKQSVYILNNEIVGGQLWWPDKSRPMKVNNIDAFGISVETFLTALGTHPNYTGVTILRSYSPDHYEGGAWNTGGSCTGKVKPLAAGELVENGFTNIMHEKQVAGFNRALLKITNKSRMKLMDITEAFGYRHDGHPGPYRNLDPNKLTKRGPHGRPPPQDCLHWCMPGPVDTWNELVLEVVRREYEGNMNS